MTGRAVWSDRRRNAKEIRCRSRYPETSSFRPRAKIGAVAVPIVKRQSLCKRLRNNNSLDDLRDHYLRLNRR